MTNSILFTASSSMDLDEIISTFETGIDDTKIMTLVTALVGDAITAVTTDDDMIYVDINGHKLHWDDCDNTIIHKLNEILERYNVEVYTDGEEPFDIDADYCICILKK